MSLSMHCNYVIKYIILSVSESKIAIGITFTAAGAQEIGQMYYKVVDSNNVTDSVILGTKAAGETEMSCGLWCTRTENCLSFVIRTDNSCVMLASLYSRPDSIEGEHWTKHIPRTLSEIELFVNL